MTTRLEQMRSDDLAELCRRRHISKLALFGSVLRPDFRPDSDVDVLVEFEPGQTPGLAFFDIEAELSQLLGRRVNLNTPQFLSPRFRASALACRRRRRSWLARSDDDCVVSDEVKYIPGGAISVS